MVAGAVGPQLPPGREVELPGRGTTFVREVQGPPGAATLVLLHGWTATGDLNWFSSFHSLGVRFRVVSVDHRGHGRGIRSSRPFRLEDCADDVAALVDALALEKVVPVGYSMGGPVAQLVWRRHPGVVAGLVLCATARSFMSTRQERMAFAGLAGLATAARLTPGPARRWVEEQYLSRRARAYEDWAAQQLAAHEWPVVLQAGAALGRFSSRDWIGEVDVPTAVVVTMRDRVVPPTRQLRLVDSIPGAQAFRVDADHDACVASASRFVPALVGACAWVTERGVRAAGARGVTDQAAEGSSPSTT
jgi:3-oxoadipate enol-lactonase